MHTYIYTWNCALLSESQKCITINFNVIGKFLRILVSIQWDPPQTSFRISEFHCISDLSFLSSWHCWNKEYMKCPNGLLEFLTSQVRMFVYSLPHSPVLDANSVHLCSKYLRKYSNLTATHSTKKESKQMGLSISQHK